MIRAVLFDLDDTLVDHQHAHRAALAGVREHFAALQAVELDALLAESTRVLACIHLDVQLGRIAIDEARIARYRQLFAFAGVDDSSESAAAADLSRRLYRDNRRCVTGACELLALISQRASIAVVTNNTTAEQTEKLARFGLAPYVRALVTSADVGVAKPARAMFDTALARLECAANEAVMVGDSLEHDIRGALDAGIAAVWLDRFAQATGNEAFGVLRSLAPAEIAAQRILGRAA